jgi:DNA invertase Pin-like site-specific DNA recombinase
MKPAFIYARVSTADKEQNPEVQLRELREWCQYKKVPFVTYVDTMSGSKSARPQFQAMLADVRRGKASRVVVFRLARFARSTRELVNWLDEFRALGVDFVSLHEAIDTSTPQGRLLYRILAALAEFELDIIRENVRAGLENARAKGKRLGRPRRIADSLKITTMRAQGEPWRAVAQAAGVSIATAKRIDQNQRETAKTAQKPVEKIVQKGQHKKRTKSTKKRH